MNVVFEVKAHYVLMKDARRYECAESFALDTVYKSRVVIADSLGIVLRELVLIAVSRNGKIVVICDSNRYRDWLYRKFKKPSRGIAQFYDDVKLKDITDWLDLLFQHH